MIEIDIGAPTVGWQKAAATVLRVAAAAGTCIRHRSTRTAVAEWLETPAIPSTAHETPLGPSAFGICAEHEVPSSTSALAPSVPRVRGQNGGLGSDHAALR